MAEINIDSLKPNSHKYKNEKRKEEKEKKTSPIVDRSQIVSTKKPIGKKFAETFFSEDIKDIKDWLIKDVLLPGIQTTILDTISMMFFGVTNSNNKSRWSKTYNDDYTNYRSYYKSTNSKNIRSGNDRDNGYASDNRVDFRNIILRNRDDAENIIEEMRRRIRNENSVSVAELFDLIDIPGRYTDNNWGWDDERDIGIRRVSSGFLIDVAEPKYLN